MEFDKKDNELIDEITDYFERKYGTAIVIVANDEDSGLAEIMKAIGKEDFRHATAGLERTEK